MSDAAMWKGYVNANDDVRHMYEQVFYGRQLTGNVGMPEPVAEAGIHGPGAAPDAFAGADATAGHDHADFYNGVWGETLPPEASEEGIHGAPQLGAPTIDVTPGQSATAVEGPTIEAPAIEAPKIEPPSQDDDMTPGY